MTGSGFDIVLLCPEHAKIAAATRHVRMSRRQEAFCARILQIMFLHPPRADVPNGHSVRGG